MGRQQIFKNSLVLIFLTFCSRILGLVREMVRAAFLGTTAYSDAFSIAFLIPNLLRKLFAEGSIAVAFVPTFKGYLLEDDKTKIKEFLSALFTVISFLVTFTVVIGIFISPWLIRTFYGDLPTQIQAETAFLTQIMFPFLACVSVAAFFQGILNSQNIFGPSGIVPSLFNIAVIICTIGLTPYMENPARAMSVGVVIGGLIHIIWQAPYVARLGYKFVFVNIVKAFANPGTKKVLRLISPTIIGMAAYEVNLIISSIIASSAGTGVVSSLQFSNRLLELLLGIIAVSLGTVILTELSENAKKGIWDKFRSNMLFAVNLTALATIPCMLLALLMAPEIISLLFKIKTFDDESVRITAVAFSFHISGLYFIAANRVIAPAFYAQEDTRSPTIAGMISVLVNIAFSLSLVGPMKGGGIAFAATIAAFVNTAALLWLLSKKQTTSFKSTIIDSCVYALKVLAVAAIAIAPVYFLKSYFYGLFSSSGWKIISLGIPLCITTALFFFVFFAVLAIFKDTYMSHLISTIKRRLGWKNS